MKSVPIGEVLKEYGYISEEQLNKALQIQKSDGKRRIGTVLVDLGYITETQVLQALGKKLGFEYVEINNIKINIAAVSKIPKPIAIKYNAIAIGENNGRLAVVMSDPLNFYAQEDIKQITGLQIEVLLSETDKIAMVIEKSYSEVLAKEATKLANTSAQKEENEIVKVADKFDGEDDVPVIKLINSLLIRGYSSNVSDIHIEPFKEKTVVRMRIDGVIVEYVTLSKQLQAPLIARIKIMSNMDIAEKRTPQDGHFKTTIDGFEMNIRVSILPTVHGEKAVLRFLASESVVDNAGQFGMGDYEYEKIKKMLNSPNGIIYITGPTGSGKTTTLYMMMDELSKRNVNISTIEDPVERHLDRINQTQVNNAAGMTFEVGLRALLRQDPDIIMVGETRDGETASISVRAAITGHLVLSTLHTNDALSSIVRLSDMGVQDYLIANSLVGLVAQRLIRKVCPNCGYEYEPSAEERLVVGDEIKTVRKGKGCHMCNNTGYKGRMAIHEIVYIDKTIRKMISTRAEMDDILMYAKKTQKFKTLKDSAQKLVEQGITSVEEMLKITYYSD